MRIRASGVEVTVDTIDGKRIFKELYSPPRRPVIVEVPELLFVMVEGEGEPESSESFQATIGALYGVVYTLKFLPKKRPELDWPAWKIMPLEGLWFGAAVNGVVPVAPAQTDALPEGEVGGATWQWTLMIALPDFFADDDVGTAKNELRRKGKGSEQLDKLRLQRFAEGLSVQTMYVGPYDQEGETIEVMHAFARDQGYELRGRHHEIYLGDPRRTPPEKLKTVLRHPVRPAG
jgi:hypothetical protein